MKTLEDALSVAGEIDAGYYQSKFGAPFILAEYDDDVGLLVYFDEGRDDCGLTPTELRRIADHLDPPATDEPRGCPLPGACSCSTATLYIDRIKAEARREALEDAGRAVARVDDSKFDQPETAIEHAVEAIRVLIKKDPQPDSPPFIPEGWRLVPVEITKAMKEAVRENGGKRAMIYALAAWYDLLPAAPKPPLRTEAEVRKEARREALEEAAKVCDALQRKHDAAFDGVVDRARDGVTNLELAGAAAAGMETSARKAAAAIRTLIDKTPFSDSSVSAF